MGKWTLAHTEALCSEKFHTALQKPLSQSGLKLDEFFEAFDPQDPVVQKLIGALVNDIVLRRKSSTRTSCPTTRVSERCAEASFYINYRATDAHPSFSSLPPTRARSSTIRARRRNELYGIMGVPQASEMPWRTSYSSWSPDAEELIPDQPSPASVMGPYRSYPRPEPMPVEDMTQPESESSGEYWWRAAMQGHTVGSAVSQSASPTPFIHDRSPSPHLPRSPRLPPGHGFVPWATARPPRRPTIVVEPELPPSNPRPVRVRSSSLPPASSEDIAAASSHLNPSIALREGEPRSFAGTPHPESPLYSSVPIPGVEVTAVRSPDLAPYQPTNVEVFRFDQVPSWVRSPSPMLASLAPSQPGPTTVTVEDSLWR
ncbi:hypothetical protein FS837_011501 [Tulasnella sp. UAMH 9824]|nr:hypothetical protein FS837_011501 [Tulasnella sp. UAMH 9824]